MGMTLEEATLQLATINTAIQQIISGKRLTQLKVGSGTFQRLYVYEEVSLESLTALRAELLATIQTLNDTAPVFRKNTTIPLLVSKDVF